jgi:hypothetical protein
MMELPWERMQVRCDWPTLYVSRRAWASELSYLSMQIAIEAAAKCEAALAWTLTYVQDRKVSEYLFLGLC